MNESHVSGVGLRCSANAFFLFPGRPLPSALDAALAAGFRTVELIDPWVMPIEELARALVDRGLALDLFNLPAGDLAAGERGFAGDPARRASFRAGIEGAMRLAELTGTRKVNALAGRAVPGEPREAQLDCLVENLAYASDRLAEVGVRLVTELLNPVETPGYLLATVDAVCDVLDRLGGRVGFQLDVYHLQRARGELIPTVRALADVIGHVQVADAPERSEPGTGEINLRNVLAVVAEMGYRDLIGLEYRPSGRTADPFAWVEEYGLTRA